MNEEKTIGTYIRQIGAYGILVTALALGIGITSAFWSSSVSNLNSQLSYEREEKNKVYQELMSVKEEFSLYRNTYPSKSDNIHEPIINSPFSNDTIKVINKAEEIINKAEIGTISTEQSMSFFGGDLTISLIATPFGGNPLHHRVLANVSSSVGAVQKIENQDIGYVLMYKCNKHTYRITILEASTFSAKFLVTKLNNDD